MFFEHLLPAKLWNYKCEQVIVLPRTLEKTAGKRHTAAAERKEQRYCSHCYVQDSSARTLCTAKEWPEHGKDSLGRWPNQDVCQKAAGPQQVSGTASTAVGLGELDVNWSY